MVGDQSPIKAAPVSADRPALRAERLSRRFGAITAVQHVDLELHTGETLALLGPNGAGKTTTVRMLTTLLRPDGGRAWIHGLDVVEQADGVRRLIGLSGQYAAVDAYLTGRENLRMMARLHGLDRPDARRRAEELLDRLALAGAADRQARTYSGGMRRRLDIAASLVAAPRVLFLDEPTTGLDPHGRLAVWDLLGGLTARGTSLLLTTQDMEEADRLADRVVVLGDGRVVAEGTPEGLKHRLGGHRLELRTTPDGDPGRLTAALGRWRPQWPLVDVRAGRAVLAVDDAPAALPGLERQVADEGLQVVDLALRPPTLDDVFLDLTGHPTHGTDEHDAELPADVAPAGAAAPVPDPGSTVVDGAAPRAGGLVGSVGVVTGRNLLRLVRIPTLVALATIQPLFFVLLFTAVFGGAVDPPGVENYVDYVLPGLLVLAIGFGASQTGVAVAEDLATGMTDRFRSLPIAGVSVLAARVLADAVRNLFVVGLMLGLGAVIGFRFHAGPAAAVGTVALALAVGLALSWINVLLGLLVGDAESAGLAGLFPVIVLVFTSSTLVPVATMPGWLQPFARVNPITVVVDALRVLVVGGPTSGPLLQAVAWIVALLAVTVPTAVHHYRRTVS